MTEFSYGRTEINLLSQKQEVTLTTPPSCLLLAVMVYLHGFINLDGYPICLGEEQINKESTSTLI